MTHAYQIQDSSQKLNLPSTLPLNVLIPSDINPRKSQSPDKIKELSDSLLAQGQIQNLLVRPIEDGFYEVFSGNRRLSAFNSLAQQDLIEVDHPILVVIQDVNDEEAYALAIAENIIRETMGPIEECDAIRELASNSSAAEISRRFGLNINTVNDRIAISLLDKRAKTLIEKNERSLKWGSILSKLDVETQNKILNEIDANKNAYKTSEQIKKEFSNNSGLISTIHALFDIPSSGLNIQNNLFNDEPGHFTDVNSFWEKQNEAIGIISKNLEDDGHKEITVLRGSTFPHWDYEVSVSSLNSTAFIVVSADGSVKIHKNLIPIAHVKNQKENEINIVDNQEDQLQIENKRNLGPTNKLEVSENKNLPDISNSNHDQNYLITENPSEAIRKKEESITVIPPESDKAIAYLAQIRIQCAGEETLKNAKLTNILIAAMLIGEQRLINLEKPPKSLSQVHSIRTSLWYKAKDEWNETLKEASAYPTPIHYLLTLQANEIDYITRCGITNYIKNNIGKKTAFTENSLPAQILDYSNKNIRSYWTPDKDFLSLLTHQELILLCNDLLDEEQLKKSELQKKSQAVKFLSDAFLSAKNQTSKMSKESQDRLNSWFPSYL